jgi:DNA-binding LacI/PurR family transcriptional regulator
MSNRFGNLVRVVVAVTRGPGISARRITIRDVARAAGVSLTTVSDALNGKGRVEASTREHVAEIATELGYQANRHARSLRSGRTMTLALVLPRAATRPRDEEMLGIDYYMELASTASRAAFERDHAVLLLPPLSSTDDLRRFAVDGGIIVDPRANDRMVELFDALGLPWVTVDRDLGRPDDHWWVSADNEGNTTMALDHLWDAGARRIALLTARAGWSWFRDSRRAYRAWAGAHGQQPIIAEARLQSLEPSAAAAAGALLDGPDRPDAVFAPPDRFAAGILRAARERGLRVPEDLRIAAGVDSHLMLTADPPITALDLQPRLVGDAAVDLLIARIRGDDVTRQRTVGAALRARASTA